MVDLGDEDAERLAAASHHWREGIAGGFAAARTCLELSTPEDGEDLWELRFGLQAEADPSLKLPASAAWATGANALQLGEITVEQPGEVLLEGFKLDVIQKALEKEEWHPGRILKDF